MQRADRWVTGFQKHRYGPALWHNKLTHTYFLCLCPLSHPVLVSLEKYIYIFATWTRFAKDRWNDRGRQNLNRTRLYIRKIPSASDLLCCFMAPYLQGFPCLHFRVKYCCLSIYSSLQQPLVGQLPLNFTRVWMLPYRICDPRHTLQHKQSSVEVQ